MSKTFNHILVAVFSALFITGCGGGGSSSNGTSGVGSGAGGGIGTSLAPVVGASCTLTNNGVTVTGGPFITGSNGLATLPTNVAAGFIILTCTGGNYIDESRGLSTAADTLRAATNHGGGPLNLTASPLTEIAIVQVGTPTTTNITAANAAVADRFGLDDIDITNTLPTDLNNNAADTSAEGQYGLVLAALSQLVSNSPTTTVNSLIASLAAGTGDLDASNDISAAINDLQAGNSAAARRARQSQAAANTIAANDAVSSSTAVVNVTGVEITNAGTTTGVVSGATLQLTFSILPRHATTETVTWASGNTATATVDANGLVTTVGTGTVVITVTSDDANRTATHTIMVSPGTVPVDSVTTSFATTTISADVATTSTITVLPANATNNDGITWTSSDTSTATVDANGRVFGVSNGTTDITASVGGIISNITTITVINTAPVITQGISTTVSMSEDGNPTAFSAPTITATDIDGDTLTWSLLTPAINGTATASGTGSSPTLNYTPTTDFNGTDSFVIQVSDGNGGTDSITVNVTIDSVNDTPVANPTTVTATNRTEGEIAGTLVRSSTQVQSYFTDSDGDTLTYSITNGNGAGVFAIDTDTGSVTLAITLAQTQVGTYTLGVTATDGTASATTQLSIEVLNINDAPTINQGASTAVTMSEDGNPTAFSAPTITATDIDGDTLTWSLLTPAINGTATASGTGSSPTLNLHPNY